MATLVCQQSLAAITVQATRARLDYKEGFRSACFGSFPAAKCSRLAGSLLSSSASVSNNTSYLGLVYTTSNARKTHELSICCEQAIEELPEKLQKIVKSFQAVQDPRARYQQLLFYAKKLKPLAKEHQVSENKVTGCVSQVWVLPSIDVEGRVHFQAESDSALTKGLAALLVEGLSGATPTEIVRITPDFVQMLGLKQSLTPSRNNGFLNMLRLMQKKTLELFMQWQASQKSSASTNDTQDIVGEAETTLITVGSEKEGPAAGVPQDGSAGISTEPSEGSESTSSSGSADDVVRDPRKPIYSGILFKLEKALEPVELVVDDVSHQHAGHAGVHRGATETHFNVKVVSPAFDGLSTIKRHRLIYTLLDEELKAGLHALSLITKTPSELERV
eukprot:jgi/Mesen1/4166/ME000219S03292